jgi:hypothetical protein
MEFFGYQFGCPPDIAAVLMSKGLVQVRDIWDANRADLLEWPKACTKFNLTIADRRIYLALRTSFPQEWHDLLLRPNPVPQKGEFIGLF